MSLKRLEWTPSHHGVSHLEGLPDGFQISMEGHGDEAEVYLLALHSSHPFTPTRTFSGPVESAIRTAECWAVELRDEWEEKS